MIIIILARKDVFMVRVSVKMISSITFILKIKIFEREQKEIKRKRF